LPRALKRDPLDVAIGARLRVRRQEAGRSQQWLGDCLQVSFQQLQKYEQGTNRISAATLVRAARALGCSAADLLGVEPPLAKGSGSNSDALEAELSRLLAVGGAVDLLRAFARIEATDARNALIVLARRVATLTEPDAP
jgi:transcriptional regulator with XRE-family HTH domain